MHVVRSLLPGDAPALRQHLLELDPEDRRLRFGHSVSDQVIDEYVAAVDWTRAELFGWLEDGRLIGVAELAYGDRGAPVDPRGAELAITVLRDFQNRGIASELMRRALVTARNRNVATVTMQCLIENRKMQHLARKFEGALHFEGGEVEADVSLEGPNALTVAMEVMDRSSSAFGTAMDQLTPRPRRADGTR